MYNESNKLINNITNNEPTISRPQSNFPDSIKLEKSRKHQSYFGDFDSIIDRNKKPTALLTDHNIAEDFSKQICLFDFQIFSFVHPVEFLTKIWKKPDEKNIEIDPRITPLDAFIARFNQESFWAVTEIVSQKDIKKRITVLKNIIRIIKVSLCYQLELRRI